MSGVDEGALCLSSCGCDSVGGSISIVGVSHQPRADHAATRTSTRPPPRPASSPCPYRTLGRKRPYHSPIRLSKIIQTTPVAMNRASSINRDEGELYTNIRKD